MNKLPHPNNLQGDYVKPSERAPIDALTGLPKYKGKKRGRKPKPRQRHHDPNRPKRKHTGYTLYMQQTYPGVKAQHPSLPSKDVISMVAGQWKHLTADEQLMWKNRAKAESAVEDAAASAAAAAAAGIASGVAAAVDAALAAGAAAAATVDHDHDEEDEEDDDGDHEEEDDDEEEEEEDEEYVDAEEAAEEPSPSRRSKRAKR